MAEAQNITVITETRLLKSQPFVPSEDHIAEYTGIQANSS